MSTLFGWPKGPKIPLDLRAQVGVISLPPNKVVRGPSVGSPAKYNTFLRGGNKREPARHVQPCLATGPATNSPGPNHRRMFHVQTESCIRSGHTYSFFRLREWRRQDTNEAHTASADSLRCSGIHWQRHCYATPQHQPHILASGEVSDTDPRDWRWHGNLELFSGYVLPARQTSRALRADRCRHQGGRL